jgi:hypothetical protein
VVRLRHLDDDVRVRAIPSAIRQRRQVGGISFHGALRRPVAIVVICASVSTRAPMN